MYRLLLSFVAIGLAVAQSGLNYHNSVGIPLARRIWEAESRGRIVGGSTAALGQHPHFAGLLVSLYSGETSVCGSSLVSNTKLVTAAHCWDDGTQPAYQMEVVLGSVRLFGSGTRLIASGVALHAQYNPALFTYDVAVLTVPRVDYTNYIQPISLPAGSQLNSSFAGEDAQAVGYGKTTDWSSITTQQVLSFVTVRVIENAVCAQTYGTSVVTPATVCTSGVGGASTCGGDSGGPLAIGNVLIGVTTFMSGLGCQVGLPSGYTRVSAVAAWIQSQL